MKYLITYTNGVEVPVEAASMDDDGLSVKLLNEDGAIIYRVADSEIVCCEPIDVPFPDDFAVEETRRGVVLKHADGKIHAAYRRYK